MHANFATEVRICALSQNFHNLSASPQVPSGGALAVSHGTAAAHTSTAKVMSSDCAALPAKVVMLEFCAVIRKGSALSRKRPTSRTRPTAVPA
jgi:hypothetical protein